MIDIEVLIAQAAELETLPASAARLATLVAAPEPDLEQIVEHVELDPAVTAGLLRLANSAAMGTQRRVATVREAVLRLGAAGVLRIVTGISSKKIIDREVPEYGLPPGALWRHSRTAALAVELIRRASQSKIPPESVTAALLHDIGKIVLAQFMTEEIRDLLDRAYALSHSYRTAEREVLGVSQSELGGLIAERWTLPDSIVKGITYGTAPDQYANTLGAEPRTLALCHAVNLANFFAKCNEAEGSGNTDSRIKIERTANASAFTPEVLSSMAFLGVSPVSFSKLCSDLSSAVDHAE